MVGDEFKVASIPAWQKSQPTTEPEPSTHVEQSEPSTSDSHSLEETGIAPGPEDTTPDVTKEVSMEQVLEFLSNPNVKDAPEDKKRAFLEAKGVGKDMVDKALEATKGSKSQAISAAEFQDTISKTVPSQQPPRDVPPIVTYPEFLVQPQQPPPLVTVSRLVNTAYVAGGLMATLYGFSKYVIGPMTDSLTEARHDFAQHTDAQICKLNAKLESVVSNVPATVKAKSTESEAESDVDSVASDPTELYHRDMATQTSPHPSRRPSLSSPDSTSYDVEVTPKTLVEKQQDRLKIISSHMDELLLDSNSNSTTNQQVQESVSSLRHYLDVLIYTPPTMDGVWTPGGTQEKKKDDAIANFKAEIRGVKGVLLSAKRFPSSTPISTRVGG